MKQWHLMGHLIQTFGSLIGIFSLLACNVHGINSMYVSLVRCRFILPYNQYINQLKNEIKRYTINA